MNTKVSIGSLVRSDSQFQGIGKVVSLNEVDGEATVAFFESPVSVEARAIDVDIDEVLIAELDPETQIFLYSPVSKLWRSARYGGSQPDGNHLVIYSRDEHDRVQISEIHVLNLLRGDYLRPADFLMARCCDTPWFTEWRLPFIDSYIKQRAACGSISSILSSSVEIEPHQIAVVRRVLEDDIKRYLLADEVGLGKTIEACLILRELVLQDIENAIAIIAVPAPLVIQWRAEMTERFYLGDLLDKSIFVCAHEKLIGALQLVEPSVLIIDEAHYLAPWAWSDLPDYRAEFSAIASASRSVPNCLLLSGTPLRGNENNFLAMLHLLSPDAYELSEQGVESFKVRVNERENLGAYYQALTKENDNIALADELDSIAKLFPDDGELLSLISDAKPLVEWNAPEESLGRTTAIEGVRKYLGENYRLHQRMLRNRRDDIGIAHLFPGLAGLAKVFWNVGEFDQSVDEMLDAYREEYFSNGGPTTIGDLEFIDWLDLYFNNPVSASYAAEKLLSESVELLIHERQILDDVVIYGKKEQIQKDAAFISLAQDWLKENPKGKIVVFCGDERAADDLYAKLTEIKFQGVERHSPKIIPKFSSDVEVRMLVCDEHGEDGLNLHGGIKLAVHYGLTFDFTRIEQRHGRLNRYSAAIHAKPVEMVVLIPNRDRYFSKWVDVLNDAIRIFDRSMASLQYILQQELDVTLKDIPLTGTDSLDRLMDELGGTEGLLEKERKIIDFQEQLNSMDQEVEQAVAFAETLQETDEQAEELVEDVFDWIVRGLHFNKKKGDIPGSYRFSFNAGRDRAPRTLVNVSEFIDKCVTGMDPDNSDWSSPTTHLMSHDRELASHGRQIYPLRYGQPFMDVIYDLTDEDPRGVASGIIRISEALTNPRPEVYFQMSWLISGVSENSTKSSQRKVDEVVPPEVRSDWLNESGVIVEDLTVLDFLDAVYSNKSQSRTSMNRVYQDVRFKPETWTRIEEFYSVGEWRRLVEDIFEKSTDIVSRKCESHSGFSREIKLIQARAVMLYKG